jgi:DNA-binding NarL/FixJ family response regulator
MYVLLADHDPKVRSALRLVLENEAGADIAGEVSEVRGLITQLERAHPDLLLLDWELPGLEGVARLPRLRALNHDMRVVVLSGRPEARAGAMRAGADEFVSKIDPPQSLLSALAPAPVS